jgi:hypothetical protein
MNQQETLGLLLNFHPLRNEKVSSLLSTHPFIARVGRQLPRPILFT